jgi:hypothetical protein
MKQYCSECDTLWDDYYETHSRVKCQQSIPQRHKCYYCGSIGDRRYCKDGCPRLQQSVEYEQMAGRLKRTCQASPYVELGGNLEWANGRKPVRIEVKIPTPEETITEMEKLIGLTLTNRTRAMVDHLNRQYEYFFIQLGADPEAIP